MQIPFFAAAAVIAGLFQSFEAVFAATGDYQCQKDMCVTAINHNNATTSYDLTVNRPEVGWMAIGFGRSMLQAPMVILWRDSTTGDTIASNRAASDFVMPTVVSNPVPVATPLAYRAVTNETGVTLSFSVPSTTETLQDLIWAWCSTPPSSNSPDAIIVEHDDDGTLTMNMANPLPDSIDGPTPTGDATPPPSVTLSPGYGNVNVELTRSQKIFIAHGVLLTVAFMVILPLGVLQVRLLRTFVPGKLWFGAHWILQWPVTTVLIVVGVALGVSEVSRIHAGHLNTAHKTWGVVLLCLYIVQCSLGGIIHFFKPSNCTNRPPQNYAHAVLGLVIVGLSFWQVHTGLEKEWLRTGGAEVPQGYWIWWKVWIGIVSSLYLAGLGLLPRQYRMERDQRENQQLPVKTSASSPESKTG